MNFSLSCLQIQLFGVFRARRVPSCSKSCVCLFQSMSKHSQLSGQADTQKRDILVVYALKKLKSIWINLRGIPCRGKKFLCTLSYYCAIFECIFGTSGRLFSDHPVHTEFGREYSNNFPDIQLAHRKCMDSRRTNFSTSEFKEKMNRTGERARRTEIYINPE